MPLALKHGLEFDDLYRRDGLARIDALFVEHLRAGDVDLHNRLLTGLRDPGALEAKAESELIIDLAPHLEDFRNCARCRRATTSWRRSMRSSGSSCSAAPSRA